VSEQKNELIPLEALEAFGEIVGPRYVTADPVHLQAYNGRGYGREEDEFLGLCKRPACVVLPETTEQVADIVKTCNRYKLPYTPVATMGMSITCPHFRDDFVVLDLKRMDKMVIDTKNLYAVVESGVLYAQLLQEAMDRDMYTLSAGGAQASVLANHVVAGTGPLTYRTGQSERRINAAEWVTPDGEVVYVGTAVNGDWFWQDGLGPNLTGIIRGDAGWMGALGIITKLSVKLYPFQPEPLTMEGRTPNTYTVLPEKRMRYFNFTMPSRESMEWASDEIMRMQLGAMIERVPLFWRVIAKNTDRKSFWEAWSQVTPEEIVNTNILRVLLVGYTSEEQLEFEERVLLDIMAECGGVQRRARQTDQSTFKYADAASMWRMTGGYISSSFGVDGQVASREVGRQLGEKLDEYAPPLMPEHGDHGWHCGVDFGHQTYREFLVYMDPDSIDPESPQYSAEDAKRVYQWYMSEAPRIHVDTGFYQPFNRGLPFSWAAAPWHQYDIWMERVKREFDPNHVSNPSYPEGNEIAARYPEFITDEVKAVLKKMGADISE